MKETVQRMPQRYHREYLPYLLVLPTLAAMAAVLLYPIARTMVMSFQRMDLLDPARSGAFIGLRNYVTVLKTPGFWSSVRITLIYVGGTLAGSYAIGLVTALLLNRPFAGRWLARAIILLPWAVPFVVGAISWTWIYDSEFGVLNFLLLRSHLIPAKIHWLTDPAVALRSLLIVTNWLQYPFVTMMLLAGLQSIPQELYEAAAIDGAGPWQRFRSITMPGLASVNTVVVVLVVIWAFKLFTIPYTMTGGGPVGSTETLVVLTYRYAFTSYNIGQASALGTLTLIIVAALTVGYFFYLSRRGDAL